ncbi:MAG: hypothetical protein AAF724_11235 [Pseudomonadota bacterium]
MSLLHISINAEEPQRVAAFLAQIMAGRVLPFPPFPDCWIAFTQKDNGTAIEVYPVTHNLRAGPEQIVCDIGEPARGATFVHAAIGSPLMEAEILAEAGSEGWLARKCNRGPFECIEVWLENRLLVEVLDPGMQADYRRGMTVSNWSRMFSLD